MSESSTILVSEGAKLQEFILLREKGIQFLVSEGCLTTGIYIFERERHSILVLMGTTMKKLIFLRGREEYLLLVFQGTNFISYSEIHSLWSISYEENFFFTSGREGHPLFWCKRVLNCRKLYKILYVLIV